MWKFFKAFLLSCFDHQILTKYSYRRLPLEQHHNTATYSNLLTNILIITEMGANWDLNLLALPLDRRLSIGVGSGDKPLALNSLNKVVDKIISIYTLVWASSYPLIIKFSIKVSSLYASVWASSYPFILPFF